VNKNGSARELDAVFLRLLFLSVVFITKRAVPMASLFNSFNYGKPSMTANLIYCYDPMCSCAWGFQPNVDKSAKSVQSLIDSRPVYHLNPMWWPRDDSNAPYWQKKLKIKLEGTWKNIQSRRLGNGIQILDFWQTASPRRSTNPACRAWLCKQETLDGRRDCTTLS